MTDHNEHNEDCNDGYHEHEHHDHNEHHEIKHRLDRVVVLLELILEKVFKMSVELDNLEAKVAAQTTVISSVEVLLTQLSQFMREHSDEPERILAAAASVEAITNRLSEAVVANTPIGPQGPRR